MLEKDVVDNSKSCAEYFEFFRNYSSSVSHSCYGKHICMLNHMYMTCHTAARLPAFDSQGCFCSLHEFLAWIFKAYTQTGNPVIPFVCKKQRVKRKIIVIISLLLPSRIRLHLEDGAPIR